MVREKNERADGLICSVGAVRRLCRVTDSTLQGFQTLPQRAEAFASARIVPFSVTDIHSRKKVVPWSAVEATGAQAALLETCARSRRGRDRSGQASREAPCRHGRRGRRVLPVLRTGSPCVACW